ncbi:HutD family protein [Luteimonas aestuarii]|uniref:HutD family protein n=1 Tax=Luteimonas aestuarii TaxID=453837 RepID=A0A4R5U1I2_9GAMM|nr:HutD family protein [Luteimonas aestuarii]TDK27456.1 HutD family protein [Luteimonas aestuarii]
MTMARPQSLLIPANEYRRVRWKNGAGWTREICACRMDGREGIDATAWDFRLSIAEIEADAPFSSFPGIDRELVLLSGNGLSLQFDDGDAVTLLPPHDRARFAGERGVAGRLVDGRTEDFNLMWRREAVQATLWHRPLVGAMVVFVDAGDCWAVHLVGGQARIDGERFSAALEQGDTALLQAEAGRTRHVIEGGGELLLVRIQPSALDDAANPSFG